MTLAVAMKPDPAFPLDRRPCNEVPSPERQPLRW